MKKISFVFALFLAPIIVIAQIPKDLKIQLQDRHYSEVTQLKIHPSGQYFCSADASGKILLWDTQDFRFVKTISGSKNNSPIRGMEFIKNDSLLLVSEGYQGRFSQHDQRQAPFFQSEYDSLRFFGLFSSLSLKQQQFSGDFFPSQVDTLILFSSYGSQPYTLLGRSRLHPEVEQVLYTCKPVNPNQVIQPSIQKAAIDPTAKFLCIVETEVQNDINPEATVLIFDIIQKRILNTLRIKDRVLHLHFESAVNALFLYVHDSDRNQIRVLKQSLENFSITEVATFPFLDDRPYVTHIEDKTKERIAFLSDSYKNSLFLEQKGNTILRLDIDLYNNFKNHGGGTVNAAAFIPESSLFVCFFHDQKNRDNFQSTLYVYDLDSKTWINAFDNKDSKVIRAVFLPDNSISVGEAGNFVHESSDLTTGFSLWKHFLNGTLSNRFGGLTFDDYMRSKHLIDVISYNQVLEEQSGKIVLVGRDIRGDKGIFPTSPVQYLVYNIVKDKVEFPFNKVEVDFHPVDYQDSTKRLLVSSRSDSDGYRHFRLIEPHSTRKFSGKYSVGALSNNGERLLLLSSSNEVEIHDLAKNMIVYSAKIDGYDFHLGQIDDNGFWLSFENPSNLDTPYPQKTLLFIEENNTYSVTNADYKIECIATRGDQLAMIIKDAGLALSETKYLVFPKGEMPISASFSKDGTILMVSFKTGFIRLYNTSDLSLRGTMVHPSELSHVVLDNSGNFLCNSDAKKYVIAEQNGQLLPIDKVDLLYNQPEKVLRVLGEPDMEYEQLLRKSATIRKNRQNNLFQLPSSKWEGPKIYSVRYEGKLRLFNTKKKYIELQIAASDPFHAITKLRVRINGVLVVNQPLATKIPKGMTQTVKSSLELTNGYNYLELCVVNEKGVESEYFQQNIFYNGNAKQSELYLLAIGVSKYQQAEHNLTFADKDALDLAILYGDSTSVDIDNYQRTFLGARYVVKNNRTAPRFNEIRQFDGYIYSPYFTLTQADFHGKYWIQHGSDSGFKLWDFDAGKIKPFPSNDLPDFHFMTNDPYITGTDGHSFFYKDKDEKWYILDLLTQTTRAWKMPFPELGKPLSDGRWVGITHQPTKNSEGESVTQYYLSFASLIADQWTYKNIAFPIKYPYITPKLVAASPKGDLILMDQDDEMILFRMVNNQLVLYRLPSLDCVYGATYAFTEDNSELSWLDSRLENDTSYFIFYKLNINENKLDSLRVDNELGEIIGINNINGQLQWVEQQSSIADESNEIIDVVRQRARFHPASFEKVHVKVLTNEEATNSQINSTIDDFLKKADLDDQLIVFLAGHGFLDTTLRYYFAPYDTDFKKPLDKGIGYQELLSKLQNVASTRKVLIMDTCHSGDIYSEEEKSTDSPSNNSELAFEDRGIILNENSNQRNEKIAEVLSTLFADPNSTSGITVLAASSGADVAIESRELSNGALTNSFINQILEDFIYLGKNSFLVEGSRTIKGELTDVFMYKVQKRVLMDTKGKQLPNFREINKKAGISVW